MILTYDLREWLLLKTLPSSWHPMVLVLNKSTLNYNFFMDIITENLLNKDLKRNMKVFIPHLNEIITEAR